VKEEGEKISRLLRTARGQIDGILKMVAEDRYCVDISNQLMAASSILRKANAEVLRAHLEHCVSDSLRLDDASARTEKIAEFVELLEKNVR